MIKQLKIPREKVSNEISSALADTNDDQGTKEAKQLGQGLPENDLKRDAIEKEHNRAEEFKKHFERISLAGLYGSAVALGLIGFSLLYHMLVPVFCHWLAENQISELKSIFTGAALTGLVATHLKKRL